MESIKLPIVNISSNPNPSYGTSGASGLDLYSTQTIVLAPGERRLIPTGVSMAIPEGFEGQVRSRSGLTYKRGLVVANGIGTIDSDYRGDIGVILLNIDDKPQRVEAGERIAQLVIARYERVELENVLILSDTYRGTGGYGSTGTK